MAGMARLLAVGSVGAAVAAPMPFVAAANASAVDLLRLLECRDAHDACSAWAQAGECARNAGFMHSSCKASCNRCALMEPDASNGVELCKYATRNLLLEIRSTSTTAPGARRAEEAARALARSLREGCTAQSERLQQTAAAVLGYVKDICSGEAGWGVCEPPLPPPSAEVAGRVSEDADEVVLAGGVRMPRVGVGTWMTVGEECYTLVSRALRLGFRHIDTSENYMNAEQIGRAIADSGVPRAELFIADKLSFPDSYSDTGARAALQKSLRALRTDYLDLYMLHSVGPSPSAMRTAWRQLEAFKREGLVKAIGVSNFGLREMRELAAFADVPPATLQNKFSAYHPGARHNAGGDDFISYARSAGVILVAYCPLNAWPSAVAPVLDMHVKHIAARIGRSPAQVLLRWALQMGAAVLTRSTSEEHLRQAMQLHRFELSPSDMGLISGLGWLVLSDFLRPAAGTPDPFHVQALEAEIASGALELRAEL